MSKEIDITTLPGYANLPDGNYAVTIKALNEGFAPSPASQPISYTKKASSTEPGLYTDSSYTTFATLPNGNQGTWNNIKQAYPDAFIDTGWIIGGGKGSSCFGNDFQGYLVIGDDIQHLGGSAFTYCLGLYGVVMSDSIVDMEDYVFLYATNLETATLSSSLTNVGYGSFGHTNLTSIIIPNSVTSIDNEAFTGCSNLVNVQLGNNVSRINRYAFQNCTSLTSITIPSSVIIIEEGAFHGCNILTVFNYTGTVAQWKQIEKGIHWHEDSPFTLIHCTDGDYELQPPAVLYYTGTQTVKMTWIQLASGDYLSFDGSMLYGRSNKTQLAGDLIIGNEVKYISEYAFDGCTSLTSVTISDNVIGIREYTFNGCTNLTTLIVNANYGNSTNSNTLTNSQNYGYGQNPNIINTSGYYNVDWEKVN